MTGQNENKDYVSGEGLIPYIKRISGGNKPIHGKCRACNGTCRTRCINTPEGSIAKMKEPPPDMAWLRGAFIHPKSMNPFKAFNYMCEIEVSEEEQTCPICLGEGFEHT